LVIAFGAQEGNIAKIFNDESVFTKEIIGILNSKRDQVLPKDIFGANFVGTWGALEVKTTEDFKITNMKI